MPEPPQNVVLTRAGREALRAQFIGWQCRIRQLAVREDGGRPSAGMRPRITTAQGEPLSAGTVMLIVESEPEHATQQFRFEYLKTQDPNERYDKVLQILQASYFQQPTRFADVLTALFAARSVLAARLLAEEGCVLQFEQYTQCYRLPCKVGRVPQMHRLYRATYWHNRLFNPNLPADIQILSFTPEWAHAAAFRRDPADSAERAHLPR